MPFLSKIVGWAVGFSGSHKSTFLLGGALLIIVVPIFLGGVTLGGWTTARKANKIISRQVRDCALSVEFTARQTASVCQHRLTEVRNSSKNGNLNKIRGIICGN